MFAACLGRLHLAAGHRQRLKHALEPDLGLFIRLSETALAVCCRAYLDSLFRLIHLLSAPCGVLMEFAL